MKLTMLCLSFTSSISNKVLESVAAKSVLPWCIRYLLEVMLILVTLWVNMASIVNCLDMKEDKFSWSNKLMSKSSKIKSSITSSSWHNKKDLKSRVINKQTRPILSNKPHERNRMQETIKLETAMKLILSSKWISKITKKYKINSNKETNKFKTNIKIILRKHSNNFISNSNKTI